jgi:hypothetical protein
MILFFLWNMTQKSDEYEANIMYFLAIPRSKKIHKSEILCFGKAKMRDISTNIYWDVSLVPYLSNILGCLSIIEKFRMLNGIQLSVDLFPS